METFKNANLKDVSAVGAETLYTTPAGSTAIVLGAAVANKSGNTVACTLTFSDVSSGNDSALLSGVQIPPNTTLEVFGGQKYVLETGDILSAEADTAASLDITLAVLELS